MSAAAAPNTASQSASRPTNGPRYDAAVERLTNLTFALRGAALSTGRPDRSAEWIHANVAGYHENPHSFRVQLQRDVATLARAGVYIESSASENGTNYRLNPETYHLPEISFSPEEATVLNSRHPAHIAKSPLGRDLLLTTTSRGSTPKFCGQFSRAWPISCVCLLIINTIRGHRCNAGRWIYGG